MKAQGSAPAVPFAPASLARTHGLWFWIVLSGLTVGTFDLLFAIVWWAPHGVAPIRIAHSIAAWVIGREAALAGGAATALFGTALHYALMTAIAAGYAVAARRYTALMRQPLRYGALYGALCYVVVHVVVVPMFSAAPPRVPRPDWTLACLLAFVLLVGIPCALFARQAAVDAPRR